MSGEKLGVSGSLGPSPSPLSVPGRGNVEEALCKSAEREPGHRRPREKLLGKGSRTEQLQRSRLHFDPVASFLCSLQPCPESLGSGYSGQPPQGARKS